MILGQLRMGARQTKNAPLIMTIRMFMIITVKNQIRYVWNMLLNYDGYQDQDDAVALLRRLPQTMSSRGSMLMMLQVLCYAGQRRKNQKLSG